jgi:hypothetical protein
MQESATVEKIQTEEQEQESVEDVTVEEETSDPYEERNRIQTEKAKAAELKAKALELERQAQARQDVIDHKIACGLVDKLYNERFAAIERNLTGSGDIERTLFDEYWAIPQDVSEIQEFDSDFPHSASKGKYSDVIDMQDGRNQFWTHHLPAIADGQLPLHKFLLQTLIKGESPLVVDTKA